MAKSRYPLVYYNTAECNITLQVSVLEPGCDISSSDLTAAQYNSFIGGGMM